MSFIFGTSGEESLIYGSLDSFLGVIVISRAHAHVLLRNSENMSIFTSGALYNMTMEA